MIRVVSVLFQRLRRANLVAGVFVALALGLPTMLAFSQPGETDEAAGADTAADVGRLRYRMPDGALHIRFAGTTTGTVRLEQVRQPVTLQPRVLATTDLRMKPLPANEGADRVGIAIAGLTFSYDDGEESLAIALGRGRGSNGTDGLSTRINGERDRTIPELDWGGSASELPASFDQPIATGRLSPTRGLHGFTSRLSSSAGLPVPGGAPRGDEASLLTYQNPGELAALYYVPLPSQSLAELTDAEGTASWTATLPLPGVFGHSPLDVTVRYRVAAAAHLAAGELVRIEFEAVAGSLPAGLTLAGALDYDPSAGRPSEVVYTLTHATATQHTTTTWRFTAMPPTQP